MYEIVLILEKLRVQLHTLNRDRNKGLLRFYENGIFGVYSILTGVAVFQGWLCQWQRKQDEMKHCIQRSQDLRH